MSGRVILIFWIYKFTNEDIFDEYAFSSLILGPFWIYAFEHENNVQVESFNEMIVQDEHVKSNSWNGTF